MGEIVLIMAIGAAYVVADLTPGIRGPGWLAFGGVFAVFTLIEYVVRRKRSRDRG